jgi:hypothetical protein
MFLIWRILKEIQEIYQGRQSVIIYLVVRHVAAENERSGQ